MGEKQPQQHDSFGSSSSANYHLQVHGKHGDTMSIGSSRSHISNGSNRSRVTAGSDYDDLSRHSVRSSPHFANMNHGYGQQPFGVPIGSTAGAPPSLSVRSATPGGYQPSHNTFHPTGSIGNFDAEAGGDYSSQGRVFGGAGGGGDAGSSTDHVGRPGVPNNGGSSGHRRAASDASSMSSFSLQRDIVVVDDGLPRLFADEPRKHMICMICNNVFRNPVVVQCGHSMCHRCVLRLPYGATCPSTTHDIPVGVSAASMTLNRTLAEEIDDLLIHCAHGCKPAHEVTDGTVAGSDSTVGDATVEDSTVGDTPPTEAAERHAGSAVESTTAIENPPGGIAASDNGGEHPGGESFDGYVADPSGCQAVVRLGSRAEHEMQCPFRVVPCPNSALCPPMRQRALATHLDVCTNVSCANRDLGCAFTGSRADVDAHVQGECKYELVRDVLATSDAKVQTLTLALERRSEEIEALKAVVVQLEGRLDATHAALEQHVADYQTHTVSTVRDVQFLYDRCDFLESKIAHAGTLSLGSGMGVAAGGPGGVGVPAPMLGGGAPGLPIPVDLNRHTFKCIGTFQGHTKPVWALAVYRDLLFSGSDETIKVWDMRSKATFSEQCTLQGHRGEVLSLATHENLLFSGSKDTTINVWRIDTMELEDTLSGHDNVVCCLAVANGTLFSGSHKVVHIWDTRELTHIGSIGGFNHWVRALVATPQYLYAGSYQVVSVWPSDPTGVQRALDAREHRPLHSLKTGGLSIYSLVQTDQYIIAGTCEHAIYIWDVTTYAGLHKLSGHTDIVYALAVMQQSNGDDILFSSSNDRTIRVWSLETMQCVQTLSRHENGVAALAVSNHKQWLCSGAADCNIKVWE
eukprot:m.796366 g.796366  ORF g.796366 m.796366 type:complete len:858 (-) comp23342_c0_seq2:972-3545(-)